MTRLVAGIVAVICLAAAEVLTLAFTNVSEGYTILAAFSALIAMVAYLSNGKPLALTTAMLLGAVPPSLVIADAAAVPLLVVAPAILLLLAAESATMAAQRTTFAPDTGDDARSQALDIARLGGMAAAGALVVGLIGRIHIGSGIGLVVLGVGAVFGLLYVISADPGT
jgi:4-hydroxybenzoate polyprenyltransferase